MYAVQYQDTSPPSEWKSDVGPLIRTQRKIIDMLLKKGADVWSIPFQKKDGVSTCMNAAIIAAKSNNIYFLQTFFSQYYRFNDYYKKIGNAKIIAEACEFIPRYLIWHAAVTNNSDLLRCLIEYKSELAMMNPTLSERLEKCNFSVYYDRTLGVKVPLIIAAINHNNRDAAYLLLDLDFTFKKTCEGYSLIHYDSVYGTITKISPLSHMLSRLNENAISFEDALKFLELLISYGERATSNYQRMEACFFGCITHCTHSDLCSVLNSEKLNPEQRLKLVKLLVEKARADVNDPAYKSPDAFKLPPDYELEKYLYSKGFKKEPEILNASLSKAIEKRDFDLIKLYFEQGAEYKEDPRKLEIHRYDDKVLFKRIQTYLEARDAILFNTATAYEKAKESLAIMDPEDREQLLGMFARQLIDADRIQRLRESPLAAPVSEVKPTEDSAEQMLRMAEKLQLEAVRLRQSAEQMIVKDSIAAMIARVTRGDSPVVNATPAVVVQESTSRLEMKI